ncbi:MAG TPA: hypothetical protein VGI32_04585 [Steroidobacteraceae bacterium]
MQQAAADKGIELLQVHGVIANASFVLVLCEIFGRGNAEAPIVPDAVNTRLANIIHPLGKQFLRLREITRSSAFANSRSSNALVDVPDPTTLGEAGRFMLSHGLLL